MDYLFVCEDKQLFFTFASYLKVLKIFKRTSIWLNSKGI